MSRLEEEGRGKKTGGVSVLMKNIRGKRQIMIRFKVNAGSK